MTSIKMKTIKKQMVLKMAYVAYALVSSITYAQNTDLESTTQRDGLIFEFAVGGGIIGIEDSAGMPTFDKSQGTFVFPDAKFAYGSISPTKRRFGSYAEYICLPQDWNLALKPVNFSFEEAAAIPYGGLLASHLLKKTCIKRGDRVLIYGASGSIGTMAIQLAKHLGAHITSVCSRRNFALVTSLGSDRIIDYTEENAESQLKMYKYVIDAVGNSKSSKLKEKRKKALISNGKYISIDHGTPLTPTEAFFNLKTLVDQGGITPIIESIYPLEKMTEAHTYVELGHKRENVSITI